MAPRSHAVALDCRARAAALLLLVVVVAFVAPQPAVASKIGGWCDSDKDCEVEGSLCKAGYCCTVGAPNEEYCTRCLRITGKCGSCQPGYDLYVKSGAQHCVLGAAAGSTCTHKTDCRSYNCRKVSGPDKCGSGRYTGVQCSESDTGTDACLSGPCRGHCCALNGTQCVKCALGSGNCMQCEDGWLPYQPSVGTPCVWWPATQLVIVGSLLTTTPVVIIAWRRRRRAAAKLLKQFAHLGVKAPSAWVTFKGFAPVTLQVALLATDVVTDLLALAEFHINGELGYFWADLAMLVVTTGVFYYFASKMWGDVYNVCWKKTKAVTEAFCLRVLVRLLLLVLSLGLSPILLMLSPVVSIADPGLAGLEAQDDPRILAAIEEVRAKEAAEREAERAAVAARRRGDDGVGEVVGTQASATQATGEKKKKGAWRKSIPMSAANKLMLVEAFVESLPQSALQITALATSSGEGTDLLLLISVSITMVSLATKFRSLVFIPRSLTLYAGLAVLTCADAFGFFFWVAIMMPVVFTDNVDLELRTSGNGTSESWVFFNVMHLLGTLGATYLLIFFVFMWGMLSEESKCGGRCAVLIVMPVPQAIVAAFYTLFLAVPALLYNCAAWSLLAVVVSAHTAFDPDQEGALLGHMFKWLRSGCGTVFVLLLFLAQAATVGALPFRMWWDAGHTFAGGATVMPGAVAPGGTYVADFALVAYTVCVAFGLIITAAGLIVTAVKKRMRANGEKAGSSKAAAGRYAARSTSRAKRVRRLSRKSPTASSARVSILSTTSSRSGGSPNSSGGTRSTNSSQDVVTKNPYAEVEMRPVVRV